MDAPALTALGNSLGSTELTQTGIFEASTASTTKSGSQAKSNKSAPPRPEAFEIRETDSELKLFNPEITFNKDLF